MKNPAGKGWRIPPTVTRQKNRNFLHNLVGSKYLNTEDIGESRKVVVTPSYSDLFRCLPMAASGFLTPRQAGWHNLGVCVGWTD